MDHDFFFFGLIFFFIKTYVRMIWNFVMGVSFVIVEQPNSVAAVSLVFFSVWVWNDNDWVCLYVMWGEYMQMWGVFIYAYDVTSCNFCTLTR